MRLWEKNTVSLVLDAQGLQTMLNVCNSRNTVGKVTQIEHAFVKDIRVAVSQWYVDLWLDNAVLRGRARLSVDKEQAAAALLSELQNKVRKVAVCSGSYGVEGRADVWRQLQAAAVRHTVSRRDVCSCCATVLKAGDQVSLAANSSRA